MSRWPIISCLLAIFLLVPAFWSGAKTSLTRIHDVRFGIHPGFTRLVMVTEGDLPDQVRHDDSHEVSLVFSSIELMGDLSLELSNSPLRVCWVVQSAEHTHQSLTLSLNPDQAFSIQKKVLPDLGQRAGFQRVVLDFFPAEDKGQTTAAGLAGPSKFAADDSLSQNTNPVSSREDDVPAGEAPTLLRLSENSPSETIQLQPEQALGLETQVDPVQSWQDRLRISGQAFARFGQDLRSNEPSEHEQSAKGVSRAEIRYSFQDDRAHSLPRFRAPYAIVSGEWDGLWFGPDHSRDEHDLDLHEAYLHWSRGPFEARLGKQLIRWGKTDQLTPLDVANHQDMRLFVLEELEERKIPNWMARLRFYAGDFTLEGVVVPFFEPNEVDYFGTNWSFYRHLREDLLKSDIPEGFKSFLRNVHVVEDEPANTVKNVQAGARVTTAVKDMDLGLAYFYGFDPMPHFTSFPVKNISLKTISGQEIKQGLTSAKVVSEDIHVDYLRSHTVGMEFETTLSLFGLRGEAVYADQRTFLTESLTSTDSAMLFWVLGADYSGEEGLYANLQLSHQHLLDHQDRILFFERHNVALNGELSREFARGRWEVGSKGVVYLSDGSSYFNPFVIWEPMTSLEVEFGLNLLDGDADTLFGYYKNNDEAYLKLTYAF